MTNMLKRLTAAALATCIVVFASAGSSAVAADAKGGHHVAFQIDVSDPAVMNQLLNNVGNMYAYYKARGEPVDVEVVAFGPGLTMLREDTSPVKSRLATMHSEHPGLVLSACENTREGMSHAEGKDVKIVGEATSVPSGVVRLSELQEQGWAYLRP